MFIRKCSIQLIRDVSGITPSSVRMFQPLGQNQTFTVHARPVMHMLFETCARKELNKFKVYVHAAGGKRFKFEDQPSFFSLTGCSTTVHLLDHFNLADHSNIQDMKVTVVKQVNSGTASRQREERRLIFKPKMLAPSGMNIDFKFI